MAKKKIYKVDHEEPYNFKRDYILLPYGEYYKTAEILSAKPGDTLRFFNGRDAVIYSACIVDGYPACDALCYMRYEVPWTAALHRWTTYAKLEGHNADILSPDKCILITFNYKCQENNR